MERVDAILAVVTETAPTAIEGTLIESVEEITFAATIWITVGTFKERVDAILAVVTDTAPTVIVGTEREEPELMKVVVTL